MTTQAEAWARGLIEWHFRHDGFRECVDRAKKAVREANETIGTLRALRLKIEGGEDGLSEVERLRERVAHLEALLAKEQDNV